jgi:hypothetical protein
MNKTDALNVVAQACAAFKGTLADHQAIQQALEVLKVDAAPKSEPDAESEPKKPRGRPKAVPVHADESEPEPA